MKVTLENISKNFGHTKAVNNFSAVLPDGNLICLLGPSGCGKTTILNMLCGILNPTSGKIFFDNEDVTALPSDLRGIGMVFQNYALYPHMSVLENICFPLEVQKVPKKERKERAEEIARLVHVEELLSRFPGELSGGQQQRVAIARALVKKPKLLLMDEPLSNLDARLRLEMREEIRRIQIETGVTTVFVTHDQDEAMAISDNIILLKEGQLVQEGKCQDLYNNPANQFVADFLGNPPVNKIEITDELEKALKKTLPAISELKKSHSLILAVRPEAFLFGKKGLEAKVFNISQMGKEQILTLSLYGNNVRAILNTDDEFEDGQIINLSFKEKGLFLFDKATGERLF